MLIIASNITQWSRPTEPAPDYVSPETEPSPISDPIVPQNDSQVLPNEQPNTHEPINNVDTSGQSVTKGLVKFALLPFTGRVFLITYIIITLLINFVELIIGFTTLGTYNSNTNKLYNFIQAYLLVDAFVSLLDLALQLVLLNGPGSYLLKNYKSLPPVTNLSLIPMANAKVLFPTNQTNSRNQFLFTIRTFITCLVFLFHLVWHTIGLAYVSTTVAVKVFPRKYFLYLCFILYPSVRVAIHPAKIVKSLPKVG